MADPFVGEVRLFAGNFAPVGWALCQGQLLAIADNAALFSLIGTTYGGDGANTFALPDLSGRVPLHQGGGPGLSHRAMGESGGSEQVTLTPQQMAAHTHGLMATSAPALAASGPAGSVLAAATVKLYGSSPPTTQMATGAVVPAGGAQPHDNMAPFVAMNYIISLFGVYPSQA
jgi:microcystin-dependent protein